MGAGRRPGPRGKRRRSTQPPSSPRGDEGCRVAARRGRWRCRSSEASFGAKRHRTSRHLGSTRSTGLAVETRARGRPRMARALGQAVGTPEASTARSSGRVEGHRGSGRVDALVGRLTLQRPSTRRRRRIQLRLGSFGFGRDPGGERGGASTGGCSSSRGSRELDREVEGGRTRRSERPSAAKGRGERGGRHLEPRRAADTLHGGCGEPAPRRPRARAEGSSSDRRRGVGGTRRRSVGANNPGRRSPSRRSGFSA